MSLRIPPERRRTVAIAAGVVIGVAVIVGVVVAVRLVRIEHRLSHARDQLNAASAAIEQGRLGEAEKALRSARSDLVDANSQLYGRVELDVVGWLPVVKQNLDSLRNSVALALTMATGGDRILAAGQTLQTKDGKLEVSLQAGSLPLSTVQRVQSEVEALDAQLPFASEEPSRSWLVGPLANVQRDIYAQAGRRRAQLTNVGNALALLSDMAGANGDRRYLIAVANSAEMRGAGGMILSYGVLTSSNGKFSLGDFGGIDDLELTNPVDPASLHLPADYLARWQGLDPTLLWRNTTLAPDFRFDAPVMEAMYQAKTGLPVDGVVQIDSAGLAAILTGTGPINVATVGSVTADNVVDLTLNRAYVDFPNRDQRQEVLGDVAKEAFRTLTNGTFTSIRPFGDALFKAAAGRHLIFYANADVIENHVASFGADGALPAPSEQDYAILTVQNFSKNKLDYYVDTTIDLAGTRDAGKPGTWTATIKVANTAPVSGGPAYVVGPNAPGERAGLYRAVVSLYLPAGATLTGANGDAIDPPALGTEDGRTYVSFSVNVPAGTAATEQIQVSLAPRPGGPGYRLSLVPVPRVRPTVVSVDVDAGDGAHLRRAPAPLVHPEAVAVG